MTEKHTHCLICNFKTSEILKGYEKDHLVKCKSCGFVFCEKVPTDIELLEHYNGYPRNNYNSPITIKRYNELLDAFESFRKTNNIIDIGCGDGYFLEVAKKRGWNVYGTEFTEDAIQLCNEKGISMQKGILSSSNYENIEFDVITSFEVIEHINNPQSEILNIKKVLRTDGLFYFTTPNFNSISRFLLKETWSIIEYPEHLSYYTAKTINRFLSNQGFKKIKLETTGISINRLQRDSKNLNTTVLNVNRDEELRGKAENRWLFKIIKSCINYVLNLFKIGDTLKGMYQKI